MAVSLPYFTAVIAVCGWYAVAMSTLPSLPVRRVAVLDIAFEDWRWDFEQQRRAQIDDHFAELKSRKPGLFNGTILLARNVRFEADALRATCFATDYASFLAWRDWGFPDPAITNLFGMGALRASDGGFLLGEMGPQTANAGRVYFPAGMLDDSDIAGDRVDLASNIGREIREETGLSHADYAVLPGWVCVEAGRRLAVIAVLQAELPAAVLAQRIGAHIAADPDSELSAVHLVRSCADVTVGMPDFIAAFLTSQYAGGSLAQQPPTR
jgi:8-oxo-dGTP pyrophosphatase MutT (NUDIX family)